MRKSIATKVALFIPNFDGGGAERSFINLARGMSELGAEVHLVVAQATGPLRFEVPKDVRIVDLGASRILFSLFALATYLRAERPDTIHTAFEECGVIAFLARRLSRVSVMVIPSIRNELSMEAKASRKRRLILWLARRLYPSAAAISAVSDGAAQDAATVLALPREAFTAIRNPTLTPELDALASEPVAEAWFAEGQPPVILACGRLAPQKDFAMLLQAFSRVHQNREARLMIIGEGPLRKDLLALAKELGVANDVALPGFDLNPFRYMSRCGLFVLSSQFEGSPSVLVQALACGAPVVSTDCPSGPAEILVSTERGILTPVGDADRMAVAIETMLARFDGTAPVKLELPGFSYLDSAAAYLALAAKSPNE